MIGGEPPAGGAPQRGGGRSDEAGAAINTFLIADVRGYTLFTQERGDEAAAKLASKFAGIAREGVEARGGSVIELRGDEALAVFPSARQAIRSALDLQDRFVAETIADPELPLPVGIGLDAGEAVPVEMGYRGGALNLAARLCGHAGPGEVLASREVTHLARRMDGVRYEDRGSVQLKGLTEPVPLVRVVSEHKDAAEHFGGSAPARPKPRAIGSIGGGTRPGRRIIAGVVVLLVVAAGTYAVTRLGSGTSRQITACQLADGPVSDRGFEQAVHEGLTRAATDLGISVRARVSTSEKDDLAAYRSFIAQDCSVIVGVFSGQQSMVRAAQENPAQRFVLLDPFEPPSLPNILGVVFDVEEGAFLAGYLAAGTTETGAVATFGGLPVPTVLPFMDGFAAGVLKYNEDNGATVQLLGWDPSKGTGSFISQSDPSAFSDETGGRRIAERLIERGADIIFPVAGQASLGAGLAARETGGVLLIGVDFDAFFQAPRYADLWLTSVRKRYDIAVEEAIRLVVDGTFEGGGVLHGSVGNRSVDLAPFHDLERRVPRALREDLAELRAGIADGSISVDPRDYPS